MAYMSKEHKARIAALLKTVIPAGWKTSLAVRHNATIHLTVYEAPVDLLYEVQKQEEYRASRQDSECRQYNGYMNSNPYHYKKEFKESLPIIEKIMEALNLDNHDSGDTQRGYSDAGHYVGLSIGNYDKPFVCTAPPEKRLHHGFFFKQEEMAYRVEAFPTKGHNEFGTMMCFGMAEGAVYLTRDQAVKFFGFDGAEAERYQSFLAMVQGQGDYSLPAIPAASEEHGTMLCIQAEDTKILITREQADLFFGLSLDNTPESCPAPAM